MKNSIVYSFLFLTLISCSSSKEEKQQESASETNHVTFTEAQMKSADIQLAVLEKRGMSELLKVNGKIDVPPQNMVSISVPLGGFLKETKLLPGMHVKKGETIAVMEDQQYIQLQQDYLTAKAKADYLEKEYARQKDLNSNKATSDKVFQQTEADYRAQKVSLMALQEKLKLIHIDPLKLNENSISRNIYISAPIDGFVSSVYVNIGKYVNSTDILFELVNPDDIHLNLTVYETNVNKLYIGQKLKAFTNANPEKMHECELLLIGQNISKERSIEVHCHFMNYDKSLIPGMYMNAEIDVLKQDAMAIPDEAIMNFEGKEVVFVSEGNNTFEMVPVETGVKEKGYTEIKDPENLKDKKIAVKGAYSLLMALKNKAED